MEKHLPKLSASERKVLYEICLDARAPITTIAKRAGLGKDAVAYHLRVLEARNIIRGYSIICSRRALGYELMDLCLRLDRIPEELITAITHHPAVFWFAQTEGRWNLCISLNCNDFAHLQRTISEIKAHCGFHIQDINLMPVYFEESSGFTMLSDKFTSLLELERHIMHALPYAILNRQLTNDEVAVLQALIQDARLSLRGLAAQTGLTPKTVKMKIDGLRASGVITQFETRLSLDILGYQRYVVFFRLVHSDARMALPFISFLRLCKYSYWLNYAIGSADIVVHLCTENDSQLEEFLQNAYVAFPKLIQHHETVILLKEYKSRSSYHLLSYLQRMVKKPKASRTK